MNSLLYAVLWTWFGGFVVTCMTVRLEFMTVNVRMMYESFRASGRLLYAGFLLFCLIVFWPAAWVFLIQLRGKQFELEVRAWAAGIVAARVHGERTVREVRRTAQS